MAHVSQKLRLRPIGLLRLLRQGLSLGGRLPQLLGALFDFGLERMLIAFDLLTVVAQTLEHEVKRHGKVRDLSMARDLYLVIEVSLGNTMRYSCQFLQRGSNPACHAHR